MIGEPVHEWTNDEKKLVREYLAIRDNTKWGEIDRNEFNRRSERMEELIKDIKARGLLRFKTPNLDV